MATKILPPNGSKAKKIAAVAAIALVVFAVALFMRRGGPTEVPVAVVESKKVSSVLVVTGNIEAVEGAVISSSLPTTQIRQVLVEKGDRVKEGQPVLQLATTDFLPNRDRARAALQLARANLQRAIAVSNGAGASLKLSAEATREVTELTAARDAAKSQVSVSENRLRQVEIAMKKVREGARDEEVRQANAQLKSASFQRDLRRKEFERAKRLLEAGAIAQASYEVAETQLQLAESAVDVARQTLEISQRPRTEDVGVAESVTAEAVSALNAAKVALRNAETSLRLRLNQRSDRVNAQTNLNTSRADIAVARASVLQAEADLSKAESDLKNATLRSPISGTVLETTAKRGESAPPGQALIRLTTTNAFRVVANVEEEFLPMIQVGQKVTIGADAFPGLQLLAEVDQVVGSANLATGTVPILLRLLETDPRIRTDLTLDINIQTAPDTPAIIIPTSALIREGSKQSVLLVEQGKVVSRTVKAGRQSEAGLIILSGLKAGEKVITKPAGLKPGQSVKEMGAK